MSFPDQSSSGSGDEPSVLDLLGFGTLASPDVNALKVDRSALAAPAPLGSRREQRELERRPSSGSAARRVRAIEKSHKKASRKLPKSTRVAIASTSASRPTRGSGTARSVGSRILSVGAMIFAGALAVGMSVPANAFNNGSDDVVLTQAAEQSATTQDAQSMAADGQVTGSTATRDTYTVTSWAEMLRLKYGTREYNYAPGTGTIRWPFPYAVPISSGFGERAAPCRGCSTNHKGLDFNPGNGAPIYAIADGIATAVEDSGGYGTHVFLSHTVNGQSVQSLYAHMQRGSTGVVTGQEVKVGDFIGLVGATGQVSGAHLHFELRVDDVPVDPFAWLMANAN